MTKRLTLRAALLVAAALLAPNIRAAEGDSSGGSPFLPGAPSLHQVAHGNLEAEPDDDEATIIERTYEALAQAIGEAGHEVAFELTDFETYYSDDFGNIGPSDVISVAPEAFETGYGEVQLLDGSAYGTYEPQWEGADDSSLDGMEGYDYSDILALAAENPDPSGIDPEHVVAVTAYRVTVHFAGKSVDYGAAFVWQAEEGGAVHFHPQDHVTSGVDEIWDRTLPIAPSETPTGGG